MPASVESSPRDLQAARAFSLLAVVVIPAFHWIIGPASDPVGLGERLWVVAPFALGAAGSWLSPAIARHYFLVFQALCIGAGMWTVRVSALDHFVTERLMVLLLVGFAISLVYRTLRWTLAYFAALLGSTAVALVLFPPQDLSSGLVLGLIAVVAVTAVVAVWRRQSARLDAEAYVAQVLAERQALEEQLLQAGRSQGLDQLVSGLAHDFNNLLVGILTNAGSALRDPQLAEPLRGVLEDMRSSAERAAHLTEQLRAYGETELLDPAPVELGDLVREVLRQRSGGLAAGVDLTHEVDPDAPCALGDEQALHRVMTNLVVNAIEALDGGPGRVHVRIGSAPGAAPGEPGRCRLTVRDSGVGMAPAVRERMFDPFFSTKGASHGLGLAAVMGIVKSHQGAIQVTSQPGQGTEVELTLPSATGSPPRALRAITPTERTDSHLRVLIIDDDAIVRRAFCRMFATLGYQSGTASTGEEGLAKLEDSLELADLVVLDMTMPGLTGLETLARIRSRWTSLPVLLASGHTDDMFREVVEGDPLLEYLRKPFSVAGLEAALERLFGPERASAPPPDGSGDGAAASSGRSG